MRFFDFTLVGLLSNLKNVFLEANFVFINDDFLHLVWLVSFLSMSKILVHILYVIIVTKVKCGFSNFEEIRFSVLFYLLRSFILLAMSQTILNGVVLDPRADSGFFNWRKIFGYSVSLRCIHSNKLYFDTNSLTFLI